MLQWMRRMTVPLVVLMLPNGFFLTLFALLFLYPDAGPRAMVFFPIAFVAAFVIAGAVSLFYWLLIRIRWWAGLPVLGLALAGLILVGSEMFVSDPAVQEALHTTCAVTDPVPGQDVSHCSVDYSLPVAQNPARPLFESHGWTLEPGKSEAQRIHSQVTVKLLAGTVFSREIGLEFQPTPGMVFQSLSFPVKSIRALAGPDGTACNTHGRVMLGQDGSIMGAWVECWTANGPSEAVPGYSLQGHSFGAISGRSWTWYRLWHAW